jgi:hypothetical protein
MANIRKAILTGAALAASLVFVAGCQKDGATSSGPSSAPGVNASQELGAAATKLNSTSYKFTINAADTTFNGAADPAAKAMKMSLAASGQGISMNVELLVVSPDLYVKISGLPLPGLDTGKWLHLDSSKITSMDSLGLGDPSDPTSTQQLAKMLVTVEKTGDHAYKGTLDLTKGSALGVGKGDLGKLGDKAKSVPFEATTDDQGRLTSLKITVPAIGSEKETVVSITFSDFGAPVNATKPAASEVQEAPEQIYQFFTS